jgi:phosphorylase superfamily protein
MTYLQGAHEVVHPQGTIYQVGSCANKQGPLRVVVAQSGMGGLSAATETERAIQFFHPHLSLFVGIVGGLKDVQLGDVVAATKVYAYESGKAGQTFEPRPQLWWASYALEQRARHKASAEAWLACLNADPAPRAYIGALAAVKKCWPRPNRQSLTNSKPSMGMLWPSKWRDMAFCKRYTSILTSTVWSFAASPILSTGKPHRRCRLAKQSCTPCCRFCFPGPDNLHISPHD